MIPAPGHRGLWSSSGKAWGCALLFTLCVYRYVLFVALVFLPSFAVTLASSLGIWSLCVRQLNTPGRARLVREVHPVTHAFNLQKKNGRVAVRRDIVDEFSWYSPALCCRGKLSTGGEADSSGCLQHLVQNSSLMFVEGFIAAVPTSPVSETQPSESDCCESAAPATSTGPLLPTLLLQSPLQRRVPADDAGEAKSLAKPGNSLSEKNGKTSLAMHLIRTCSNPESDVNLLTPGSSNKPVSSPSSLSTRSSRSHLFRRTPSSFLTTQDLADSSCVPKQGGGGGGGSGAGAAEDQQGEVGRLLSPGVCPILSNNLSLETFDMLELSMQAVAGGNLQVCIAFLSLGLSVRPLSVSSCLSFFFFFFCLRLFVCLPVCLFSVFLCLQFFCVCVFCCCCCCFCWGGLCVCVLLLLLLLLFLLFFLGGGGGLVYLSASIGLSLFCLPLSLPFSVCMSVGHLSLSLSPPPLSLSPSLPPSLFSLFYLCLTHTKWHSTLENATSEDYTKE